MSINKIKYYPLLFIADDEKMSTQMDREETSKEFAIWTEIGNNYGSTLYDIYFVRKKSGW